MLYVKLTENLKKKFNLSNELIPWTELKKLLPENDNFKDQLMKGCQFYSTNKLNNPTVLPKITSPLEYSRLIGAKVFNPDGSTTSIQQLRADLAEIRKESTWLLNCLLTSVGVSVFVYFCVSFYLDKFEWKLLCSTCFGLLLFFIEVILYIIRN